MGRITFNQVNSLPDAIDTSAFELLLGNLPNAGSSFDLTLSCLTASIPGFQNEVWENNLHGHVTKFRGRKMYTRTLAVTYREVADLRNYIALKAWDEYIVGTESGSSSGYKNQYSIDATLLVYDVTGSVAGTFKMENFFPQEVGDVQLDGQSSQGMELSATFSFDRMLVGGIPVL
jgi:hypothetical protein